MFDNRENRQEIMGVNPEYHTPKKAKRRGNGLAMLAVCAVFSSGFGFAGGYFANLNANNNTPATGFYQDQTTYHSTSDTAILPMANTTTTGALTTEQIVEKVSNTVVEITTEIVSTNNRLGQYVSEGAGSGVIIQTDGHIITNHHVIDGASKITVTTKDGTKHEATLIASDAQTDIAVLKINATGLQAATIGDSGKLVVGEFALAIGNPLGSLGGTVTDGIISALSRDVTIDGETMTLLQTNAAINPGNSGGGLFNEYGQLIGIVNAKSSGTGIEGIGFAIPINTAMSVANQLKTQGYVSGRIEMGMSLVDITDSRTAYMYGVSRGGVYVSAVTSGSSAQTAGFQSGDCITAVGKTTVSSAAEVKAALKNYKIGDTVTFTVIRGSQSGTITMKLAEGNSVAA